MRVAIADSTARTGSDRAELMPDEPSGIAAVIIGVALSAFLMLGAFFAVKDILQWIL